VSLRPGGMGMGLSLRPGGGAGGAAPPGGLALRPNLGFAAFATGSKPKAAAPVVDKSPEEVVKYARDFLMAFSERCVALPTELEFSTVEIVMNERNAAAIASGEFTDSSQPAPLPRSAQQSSGDDGRDWRARTTLPPADDEGRRGGGDGHGRGGGRGGGGGGANAPAMALVKADNAWVPSSKREEDPKTKKLKRVQGILNKLTPEKFDRLMDQLLDVGIQSAEILQGVIDLLFDKAVLEPTFVALYAECCVCLSKALPEFPPQGEETKPTTFRRVLLNTCQEQFEGAAEQKARLADITEEAELVFQTRIVKLKTMGNIKLIGELYKQKLIVEKILHACIGDLLGKGKADPPEENVEALTTLLQTVGKELDTHTRQRALIEQVYARVLALSKSKTLPSRVRFLCSDLIECRKNAWVPRRAKMQAKKLDEIHAEAAQALGIAPPASATRVEENLFPEGPNGPVGEDGWEVAGKSGKKAVAGTQGAFSALSGGYVPSATRSIMPTVNDKQRAEQEARLRAMEARKAHAQAAVDKAAAEADAAKAASDRVKEEKGKPLSEEDAEEEVKKMLQEYMSVADVKEGLLCVQEAEPRTPDPAAFRVTVVRLCVAHVLDASTEKAAGLVSKLLLHLAAEGGYSQEAVAEGLKEHTGALDDLAIDIPMAPKLLASIAGALLAAAAVPASFLADGCEGQEDAMYKREYVVAAIKALQADAKAPPVKKLLQDGGVVLTELLAGDPEFDEPADKFLKGKGLGDLLA